MNIDSLAEALFIKNKWDCEITFELNGHVSVKEFSNVLYTLFMRGLVLLFGSENKITLNHLNMDQIQVVIDKMRLAKIKTHVTSYDKETAIILDLIPANCELPLEIWVIHSNKLEIEQVNSYNLSDYVYKMYMYSMLYCMYFEIIR